MVSASTRPDAATGEALVVFATAPPLQRPRLLAAANAPGLPEPAMPHTIARRNAIPLLGPGKADDVALQRLTEAPVAGAPQA